MQLEEFIARKRIMLTPESHKRIRAFEPRLQRLTEVRGQPHLGEVIPRITDGDHAWCELPSGAVMEIHITNLRPFTRHDFTTPTIIVIIEDAKPPTPQVCNLTAQYV